MSNSLKSDTVSFTGKQNKVTPKEKMRVYAVKLLDSKNLQEDQPLYIKADSKYLPFMNIVAQEAYKKGSGKVHIEAIEPTLEAIKKKNNITEKFNYQKEREQEFKDAGALYINFDNQHNPYKKSGVTDKEVKSELKEIYPEIPKKVRNMYKINPEEIFNAALDLHKGEPVIIKAEREHLPYVEKMVDYLYSKNKTKLVDVIFTDQLPGKDVNLLKYGKDSLIGVVPDSHKSYENEIDQKDAALFILEGEDPNVLEGIDSKRIVKQTKEYRKAVKAEHSKNLSTHPWLIYYAPTTKSCADAYSEYKNPIEALSKAYSDANQINRIGHLDEHVKTLQSRAKKMNELLDRGYRTIHYVSVDPETKKPDGKTDLRIQLSPKSLFMAARENMVETGHKPMVNIPTEEVFTSPMNNTAEGIVSATMPLSLNGKIVDGIKIKFHNGRAVEVHADKNEEMLKEHISANENADRLGEVALVAGSPIAKTDRLFNNTLLDENAACHLALGEAFPECIKGSDEIKDFDKKAEYLKENHINSSPTHNDFMIGGPNVYIYAENPKIKKSINIIKDDKFLL